MKWFVSKCVYEEHEEENAKERQAKHSYRVPRINRRTEINASNIYLKKSFDQQLNCPAKEEMMCLAAIFYSDN